MCGADMAFDDVTYQLELNLQSVRRNLIHLLDEEVQDCFKCNRLRCTCNVLETLSLYDISSSNGNHKDYMKSPPPDTLPTPQWPSQDVHQNMQAIDAWVQASTHKQFSLTKNKFPVPESVLKDINMFWPPLKDSIWGEKKCRETLKRENAMYSRARGTDTNSVADFFKLFSGKTTAKLGNKA